jgi:hypothetical protein
MKRILAVLAVIGAMCGGALALDDVAVSKDFYVSGSSTSIADRVVSLEASVATLNASTNVSVQIATTAGITDTDADGASTISGIGYEANDAKMVLDADQGDDNGDTWTIESEAADNDLSIVNHTTEVAKITTAGAATFADDVTFDKWIATDGTTAAPTNEVSAGFLVTVNGTNYWLALYPVND